MSTKTMTSVSMSTASLAKFQSSEYQGKGSSEPQLGKAQILNRGVKGTLGIEVTQGNDNSQLSGFSLSRASNAGWEHHSNISLGENNNLEFITTESPRFIVLRRKTQEINKTLDDGSQERTLIKVLLVMFLDENNKFLSEKPMKLPLTTKTAGASFYDHFDNLKNPDCLLKRLWSVIPRANGLVQAMTVVDAQLKLVTRGSGRVKSECTIFDSFKEVNEETLGSGELFLGIDPDMEARIKELYEEYAWFSQKNPGEQTAAVGIPSETQEVDYTSTPF